MRSCLAVLALGLSLLTTPAHATPLSAAEQRWIAVGQPVLDAAGALGMPLDVVVQPQAAAGETPVAMAYVDGRCKLVLTLRGNPEAASLLAGAPADLQPPLMEAVVAHEVGHCWRHTHGAWQPGAAGDWREEAFADLAALAWTARRHPERYAEVHAWLTTLRNAHGGSAHDTRAFLQAAAAPERFAAEPGSAFEQALALWQHALPLLSRAP